MSDSQTKIVDPLFGALCLEQEAIWIGQMTLEPVGDVGIRVDRWDASPPDQRQRETFVRYRDSWELLLPECFARIVSFLLWDLRPIYAEVLEPDLLDEILPSNLDAKWVREQVSAATIVLLPEAQANHANRYEIAIFWECSWDPEHGVGVSFRDGLIVDVGQPVALG